MASSQPPTSPSAAAGPPDPDGLSRRTFLAAGAGVVAAGALGKGILGLGRSAVTDLVEPSAIQREALRVLGRDQLRRPGSRPFPTLAVGTDTMPAIEHIVILMLENHSYDNLLGMLGRGKGQRPRGDGFTVDSAGRPTASNPRPDGRTQHAFHMPTTCQLPGQPSQEWEASHIQFAGGNLDGFVRSASGPVAMGYWTEQDLPFTYALATAFPLADRWFCSMLGQTDPNRRFLIAGTASGMTDDIGTSADCLVPDVTLPLPAGGTIFDALTLAGVSWTDYAANFPLGATADLYPTPDVVLEILKKKTMNQFFNDAREGTLPAVSMLDPDYSTQSQENPQNIVEGEAMLAEVVRALGDSPLWEKTLFVLTYDEHGGYYDHVPPPVALKPDDIPPLVNLGEHTYDGFTRYGFRVPSVVVSPYAKRDYVSHLVYDQTSILALIERKWNLPAMTFRDANAHDLTDFLDLPAMARRQMTFPTLPTLPASGKTEHTMACSVSGPGTIPPADSISG